MVHDSWIQRSWTQISKIVESLEIEKPRIIIQNWNWRDSVIFKDQEWIVNHVEERIGVHGIVQNSMVKYKKLVEHGNAIQRR